MWLTSLSPPQRRTLLGLAHNIVVSDGLLDPNEEAMLLSFKREMGLEPDTETDYVELDGVEHVFDTPRSRRVVLVNLIRLSYADGALEIEEECLLRELADVFEVPNAEFALLDNWVKRLLALEREAEAFL
ncbi:MAG: hypothetical protein EA417_09165 [Gammaproteobacteria bacterium]|nr:MAG: hypothetical protein EA417_09165 [Gammaproteobacteria bacterium]